MVRLIYRIIRFRIRWYYMLFRLNTTRTTL